MASALENFVNNVRTLSASGSYRDLAEQLRETLVLLTKNWSILDNVLETLDIQQHTLGVLYVLLAKLISATSSNLDATNMVRQMNDFVVYCDMEQLRLRLPEFYELCHEFTSFLVNQPNCKLGIKILAKAIDRLRIHNQQLTPMHADLCQLSLKTKIFHIALRYLSVDITDISNVCPDFKGQANDNNGEAKYFLLYYYYGGMIYTAIKNFDEALYYYEVCLTAPAMAMSHIMLEAYKKFILVSLIVEGKIAQLPKNASQVVPRYMKPLATHYHDLANVYTNTSSSDEFRMLIIKYSETFSRDTNMGLIQQVAQSLYKKNIQCLTKTFLTLSLSDVASRVNLPNANDAEKYILNMIKSGEIHATINQKDGMVVFKDDPEKYSTPKMFLNIQKDVTNVMELIKQISKMEEDIILNPMYVKKALGNQDDDLASQHPKAYSGDPVD